MILCVWSNVVGSYAGEVQRLNFHPTLSSIVQGCLKRTSYVLLLVDLVWTGPSIRLSPVLGRLLKKWNTKGKVSLSKSSQGRYGIVYLPEMFSIGDPRLIHNTSLKYAYFFFSTKHSWVRWYSKLQTIERPRNSTSLWWNITHFTGSLMSLLRFIFYHIFAGF